MSTESSEDQIPNHTRRNAAIGVTAGLLGGGAVGLLMSVPSYTSAASDDSATADTPIVALQDEGVDVAESERPEPGVQLRELLQELVDAGTINTAQADAVTEHLVENRPERGERPGGHHRRGPARDGEVTAELLGIDVETLRDELKAGNSIADIATANDVDPQTVIDALIVEAEGHVDLMIEDGRLTDEEGATMKERIAERITARVNGERPGRG